MSSLEKMLIPILRWRLRRSLERELALQQVAIQMTREKLAADERAAAAEQEAEALRRDNVRLRLRLRERGARIAAMLRSKEGAVRIVPEVPCPPAITPEHRACVGAARDARVAAEVAALRWGIFAGLPVAEVIARLSHQLEVIDQQNDKLQEKIEELQGELP